MKKLSFLTFCFALGCALCALSARAENTTAVARTPEIDHMVYLSFLPDPEELMADAKAGGLTVVRLDKTADRVVVTYKYPDGHQATLGYGLLGSARSSDQVASRPVVTQHTVVATERAPEIVYVDRPSTTQVVYRDSYSSYWPPLVVGFGLGWATSYYGGYYGSHYSHGGGHYHGGYHGGHGGHGGSHGRGGGRH